MSTPTDLLKTIEATVQELRHPFHRDLAQKCGWPLVTRDGRKAEVLKWDAKANYPLMGVIYGEEGFAGAAGWTKDGLVVNGFKSSLDLFLSADYSSPAVRAAVQRAHEELGMEVKWSPSEYPKKVWRNMHPGSILKGNDYRLALHLPQPVDPVAEGHNPDKLTVSQVGEGWRLLDRGEISEARDYRGNISGWSSFANTWVDQMYSTTDRFTYRTRLSRSELAALDQPDPYAALKAAHKAGKVIQCDDSFGDWHDEDEPIWTLPIHRYRIKPWTLPEPPAGAQWHRSDWQQDELPEGWRPLLKGERVTRGDVSIGDGEGEHIFKNMDLGPACATDRKTRTKRPLPLPLSIRDLTQADLEEVRGLVFKQPGNGNLRNWDTITDEYVYFADGEYITYKNLRLYGWLYSGVGFGFTRCEKEGK